MRGRFISVNVSFNLCPLLDMIFRVRKRPFQAEETVGMSWERDKNLKRQCSLATESGGQRTGKDSEEERAGPNALAKGICVLFRM